MNKNIFPNLNKILRCIFTAPVNNLNPSLKSEPVGITVKTHDRRRSRELVFIHLGCKYYDK